MQAPSRPIRPEETVIEAHPDAAQGTAQQRARWTELLALAPDAMLVVDDGGRIVAANAEAGSLLGPDAGSLVGTPVARLLPGSLRAGGEMSARRIDGSEIRVDVRSRALDGVAAGWIVALRDVTHRGEEARERSEILASAGHDLRTPLSAIIGFSELLHDERLGPLAPAHKEHMGDILMSARHLLRLINDVIDLAKLDAGQLEFCPDRVSLPRLVEEVHDLLRSRAARKRTSIVVECDAGLTDIMTDGPKLKQVLYHGLATALKFGPEEGRVTIRALPDGPDRFRVEVHDAGGRRPETRLGLALARRIVEAQGGTTGLVTGSGGGTCFFALLPRRPGPTR